MALIKKRRFWPKYIDGDAINLHFKDKDIGKSDSLPGKMHDIPFYILGMKEPDYVMKLMSTYGTNELQTDHQTQRIYVDSEKKLLQPASVIRKLFQTTSNTDTL